MFYQKLVIPRTVPYALLRREVLDALDAAFMTVQLGKNDYHSNLGSRTAREG
jgi:hypothetical protein